MVVELLRRYGRRVKGPSAAPQRGQPGRSGQRGPWTSAGQKFIDETFGEREVVVDPQSSEIAIRYGLFGQGCEPRDRLAVTGNDDVLAGLGPLYEGGQFGLGSGDRDLGGAHCVLAQ